MKHVSAVRGGAKWGPSPSVLVVAVFLVLGAWYLPWALRPLACLLIALGAGAICVQGGRVEHDGRWLNCTASGFLGVRRWRVEAKHVVAVLTTEHDVLARTADGEEHVLARDLPYADAVAVAQHVESALRC